MQHMTELSPEAEQQLADMSDEDYRALTARVRPPEFGSRKGDAGKAAAEKRFGAAAGGAR
jgi:hypothetical protein